MPAEIPGFVYDAARGRYFRVQENHLNTQHVALRPAPEEGPEPGNGSRPANGRGIGSRYTREVIEGQKRARDEETRKKNRRRRRDGSHHQENMPQKRRGGRRLGDEIELHLRLRGTTTRIAGSVEGLIKERYATALSPRIVFESYNIGAGTPDAFAVDPVTKELFTGKRLAPDYRHHFCVTPLTDDLPMPEGDDAGHDETELTYDATSGKGWNHEETIPILDAALVLSISPISDGCAVWITRSSQNPYVDENEVGLSLIHISTRYSSRGAEVPWANWRDDFGDWGTQTYTLRSRVTWDAVGSPARDGKMLFATSKGVMTWDVNGDADFTDTGTAKEAMCVAWMDERLWLSGARNGKVQMGDIRDPNATVARLRHPGAVSAVRGLQPRCDWGLLAWGLENSSVYDLRWTKDAIDAGHVGKPNRHSAQGTMARNRKLVTRSLFEFETPESRKQRQYGMGFALDADAGIVAAASPHIRHSCHVGLWDVTTGKILEGPGPLTEKKFQHQSTSLQFVDLEGRGDGPKSLLIASRVHSLSKSPRSNAIIEAWEV